MLRVLTLSNYWDAQPPAVGNISFEQTCNIWVAAANQWTCSMQHCSTPHTNSIYLYWDWSWSEREEIFKYSSNILTECFCLMLELFHQRWIMWHGVTLTFGLWILEKRPFTPPYIATHARSGAALLLLPRAPSVKWYWPVICITWDCRHNHHH